MDFTEMIFEAGVVGCGGAGFPTHIKYKNSVRYIIVNAAECEPLLRTDRYLVKSRPLRLVKALESISDYLNAEFVIIALKKTYTKEIAALNEAINSEKSRAKLFLMDNFYPAGDEQMLVYEVTGRPVPAGGIPLDVGAIVSNVATVLGVSDALEGRAVTHRVLTVTGEVLNPAILKVPIGTSFEECINLAGGACFPRWAVISGGPLMGQVVNFEDVSNTVVTKTTSGIIVLKEDSPLIESALVSAAHILNRAKSACIQCSYCTEFCPRYLTGHPLRPHMIMRKLAYGGDISDLLDDNDVKQALICCECGICTKFACPMQLQPSKINSFIKNEYAKRGIRYDTAGNEGRDPDPQRESRKVPSKRIAARAGVLAYYDRDIENILEYTGSKVKIPLRQHIGAPSEVVVSVGSYVSAGDIIARCPEGKLGANIHASISGIVTSVSDSVVIEVSEASNIEISEAADIEARGEGL